MEKITFTCETITPMFISGADGKTAELRAPSIKGALRFWWRAINAGKYESIPDLRSAENKLFGGTDEKSGKSKLQIRLENKEILPKEEISLTPHHYINSKICVCGKGNCAKAKPRLGKYYSFKIVVQLVENIEKFTTIEIKNLIILLSLLGGIGKRSRRGFGCFRINQIDSKSLSSENDLNSIFELLISINNNFKINEDAIRVENNSICKNTPYPYIREIQIGESFKNHIKLLRRIGKSSHENNRGKKSLLGYAYGDKRFSSPVFVSVIKDNNIYRPIVTTLNTAIEEKVHLDFIHQRSFIDFIMKNKKEA